MKKNDLPGFPVIMMPIHTHYGWQGKCAVNA